jgi:hypothetical protein
MRHFLVMPKPPVIGTLALITLSAVLLSAGMLWSFIARSWSEGAQMAVAVATVIVSVTLAGVSWWGLKDVPRE